MLYGPMQLLVVTFASPDFPMDLRNQLKQVREQGIVRMVDAVFVSKDEHSELSMLQGSDLDDEEAAFMGMMAGALFGYGAAGDEGLEVGAAVGLAAASEGIFGMTENDLYEVADRIPAGSAALFILLEHIWAHGLREAMASSQGTVIAQGWITPESLVSLGAGSSGAIL
jgi:uncharacterized membrane protein